MVVAIGAVLVVAGSLWAARYVDRAFFPSSGRNQFVIEQIMPEGTHLDETDATSRQLEMYLAEDGRVEHVSAFIGRSAPKFYYNLPLRPQSPHFANLIVQTKTATDVVALMVDVRRFAAEHMPGAVVVPRKLEQGPPVRAPVELRLQGDDVPVLMKATKAVVSALRTVPGALDVRHNQGLGAPVVQLAVNDGAASRRGLARRDIAMAVRQQTRGFTAGELRIADDPIPIVVRAPQGEHLPPDRLLTLDIPSAHAGRVPLAQLASVGVRWTPAAIHRRDGWREITVSAQLAEGVSYRSVLTEFDRRFDRSALPAGVNLEIGGAAETSNSANGSLVRAAPLGGLILLFFLMAEFNSFRRVGLILSTVPLAATGVVPGLLICGQPFGFMSLLGVVALVGVVVNNAIVLLETIEAGRRSGLSVEAAVQRSVRLRARAIVLTTATTVAGLAPLVWSPSPLWPPLASSMIAGLLASTGLSLLVVPALYVLMFRRTAPERASSMRPAAATLAAALFTLTAAHSAHAMPLSEAMAAAAQSPGIRAMQAQADAAQDRSNATWRSAYLPTLQTTAGYQTFDRQLALDTPVGELPLGTQRAYVVAGELHQPLVDVGQLVAGRAADDAAAAARSETKRAAKVRATRAADQFLDIKIVDAQLRATAAFIETLQAQAAQLTAAAKEGRALKIDQLRVELALADAVLDQKRLRVRRQIMVRSLAVSMGRDEVPDPGEIDLKPIDHPPQSGLPTADTAREDLTALRQLASASKGRASSAWWSLVPRLEANARFVVSDGLPLDKDYFVLGSVDLVWRPFAAAARFSKSSAERARQRALELRLVEARRQVALEVRAAYARLTLAKEELEVAEQATVQAQQAVEVESVRYRSGRIVISELLESQSVLRERRTRRDVARIQIARASIRVQLALGTLDPASRDRATQP